MIIPLQNVITFGYKANIIKQFWLNILCTHVYLCKETLLRSLCFEFFTWLSLTSRISFLLGDASKLLFYIIITISRFSQEVQQGRRCIAHQCDFLTKHPNPPPPYFLIKRKLCVYLVDRPKKENTAEVFRISTPICSIYHIENTKMLV